MPLCLELTPREEQVVLHLADGMGEREIAGRLGITIWTVRAHRSNALRKLDCRTTAHAVAVVIRLRAAAR